MRKPPTIYDVARLAEVSPSTVSAVLNQRGKVRPELAERVHRAVSELRYTPNAVARSLPLRKARTVGLVIPDIENPFFAKVVHGVEDKLSDAGYSVLIGSSHNRAEEQERYVALFHAQQAAGLILFAAGDFDRARDFAGGGNRAVVFLGREPAFQADVVTGDNRETLRLAVDHLARRNHRRIAILCGPLELSTNSERVEGWRGALAAHGLAAPERFIGVGNWSAEAGYSLTRRMLSLDDPPTAIFAGNFLMLVGVLRALREKGLLCPRDVEVMSSDDSDWLDVFQPPVSTVVTPSYAMGAAAANLLLDRLKQPGIDYRRVVLAPELRVRAP
jgi:LacI family transcriptional regulator